MIWQSKLPEIKDILAEESFFKQYVSEGKFVKDKSSQSNSSTVKTWNTGYCVKHNFAKFHMEDWSTALWADF